MARSFSGDKTQLVPLIKAGIMHNGFAMLDVLSPCVTFNDHEDSTKSYAHTRQFYHPAVHADFVPPSKPIRAAYDDGEAMPVELHDGSTVVLRKVSKEYNPTNRAQAYSYLHEHQKKGEIVTGLLYIDEDQREMHDISHTVSEALRDLRYSELCPGSTVLEDIQNLYR